VILSPITWAPTQLDFISSGVHSFHSSLYRSFFVNTLHVLNRITLLYSYSVLSYALLVVMLFV